jgi:formamidopyrimidine-DNA glycosylase
MPELPEVETTVRGLVPVLEGRRIVSAEARRADLRWAFPPDLRQRLTGARVTGLGRRAKYGLIHTDREDTLIFHLGMSGNGESIRRRSVPTTISCWRRRRAGGWL